MMRACYDLLHALFSLQKDYNKKEGTPSLARTGSLFSQIHPEGGIQIL